MSPASCCSGKERECKDQVQGRLIRCSTSICEQFNVESVKSCIQIYDENDFSWQDQREAYHAGPPGERGNADREPLFCRHPVVPVPGPLSGRHRTEESR